LRPNVPIRRLPDGIADGRQRRDDGRRAPAFTLSGMPALLRNYIAGIHCNSK
jgi:hypothetical protein